MRGLLLLILLCPFAVCAQGPGSRTIIPLKDSLGEKITQGWLFSGSDDPLMARPDYDDSQWPAVNPEMEYPKTVSFNGLGWFRLHFFADSATASQPLTLSIQHNGASEVYLDGRLICSRGRIRGRDSSKYVDPQSIPVAFHLREPGEHVLAVRYANWKGLKDEFLYRDESQGFTMRVDLAETRIPSAFISIVALSASTMLLTGIFGALFFLHLIFFLYNRSDWSNLWFSVFSLCAALLFLTPFLLNVLYSPFWNLFISAFSFFIMVAMCFSLSGLLNALFSSSMFRLKMVSLLCLLVCVVYVFEEEYLNAACMTLFALVGLEAVFLILRAVYRKVPGARIIGAGLALLILALLVIVTASITSSRINLDSATTAGFVATCILCLGILSIPASMSAYLARNFWAVSRDLKVQLGQVQELSRKSMEQEAEKQRMLQDRQKELEQEVDLRTREVLRQKDEIERQHRALKSEKKKADDLLRNILPEEVAEELKEHGTSVARLYKDVTVLFTDFADFTQISERLSPEALVAEVDLCFKAFDGITEQFGLEKIKTVGDAYIAVAGLPVSHPRHAEVVVHAALAIRDFMVDRKLSHSVAFDIRLGVHSGPVVAGIVGLKKFAYDIWGDTVNTAARMEQHGELGKVNVSATTYALLKGKFSFTYRGELEAKHKGKMGMYFAERSEVAEGLTMNGLAN